MSSPAQFISNLTDNHVDKFKDSMNQRTLFPRSPKQWNTANYRLDVQGGARDQTCYNLQVQRNTNPKKKKTSVSLSVSTVALCIAAEDATAIDIKNALLDSAHNEGAERTAGSVPEDKRLSQCTARSQ